VNSDCKKTYAVSDGLALHIDIKYVCVCVYYIYIYICRERERERGGEEANSLFKLRDIL